MVTVQKATRFFRLHEVKCDEELVRKWMDTNPVGLALKNKKDSLDEWDMYNFSEWLRVLGTAYEDRIDEQTKITRLLEEVAELKLKNKELEQKNYQLLSKLNFLTF
ncbi:hypothetical protein ACFRCQ_20690 [Cytobacillus firmus]|uniref:hypothetical protein n=1 Tax=Cytobacillus firmus TaxID=1399 RepID=UPI00367E9DF7